MKLAILLYMLILLLPIALAETQIFSGKVITGTDAVIDGNIFRFTYDGQSNKVFVQNPVAALIIENGKCKSNNVFKVCINSANFSYKNITTYVYYYSVDAIVYKLTGSLSTSSKTTSNSLLQGESAEFTVTITNPTDFDITGISYNEDLAPFSIKEVKGCRLEDNQMTWQGSLQSKYDKICTAMIVAEKEGAYTLTGNLSYFNSYETEKKKTDSVAITVLPKQLKVSQLIDKDIEVKQPFYINLSLQNINKDEKIEASITIEVPSNIAILKYSTEFNKEFNVLKLRPVFEPGSIKNYSFYLEASSESTNPIKQKFDYTIKDIRNIIENDTFINPLEPKPLVNLSLEYAEVTTGQKFIVIAKLKNPSRVHALTDIKARLNSSYNDLIEQKLGNLMPNETYPIISNTLIAPKEIDFETGNKTISINLSIEYNFYGVIKSLNKSLELKLKQANTTIWNTSTTTKTDVQNPQETKTDGVPLESNLSNKTSQLVETKIEKPKQRLSNKELLLFGGVAFATFLIVFFIIYRVRKKRKKKKELEEMITKDISGILNKPKDF
ncbi:hypothetical protein HYX00_02880 [Candidatus Woesearchaeota archaeon]|nr:hypothetical protein [Candidatus Woesearchaeota archaeon]